MRFGLRQKLILLVLLILVPMLLMLAYNLFRFFRDLQNDQVNLHSSDARLVAVSLDRFMAELGQVARTAGVTLAETPFPADAADRYLASVRAQLPVSNIALLTTDGRLVASALSTGSALPLGSEPALRASLGTRGDVVTGLRTNSNGHLGFAVFAPVERGQRIVAVSAVEFDAAGLVRVIPTSITHGTVVVTDDAGRLAFSNNVRLSAYQSAGREWLSQGVHLALRGHSYTTRSTSLPGLPDDWLGAQVPVGMRGWTVGVYDVAGRALSEVVSEAVVTLAVLTVILLVALLLARQYALSIIEPVTRLSEATDALGLGQFDTQVPVTSGDEVGDLARDFRRMQGSLKRTFNDVQMLNNSARWIGSTLDVDAVTHATFDYLGRIIHACGIAITLENEGASRPTVIGSGMDQDTAENVSDVASGIARHVDFDPTGFAIVDLAEVPANLAQVCPGARYLVMLPLVVNRRFIGRIDALTAPPADEPEYRQADVTLAGSLAQQAAVAIENARLFGQQRAIADTLQDALLTEPYRVAELDIGLVYYQATVGGRIGGDFYDFLPPGTGLSAVVIGDITGKGLQAARYTTIGKGAIRTFALEDPAPATVLRRAGRVIHEQIGLGNFITAAYVLIDLRTGGLRYSVAGHPPPMLLHRAEDRVELLEGGGMPLGIEPTERYEELAAEMAVGDRLILYTDGLTEARRGKELFGGDRVALALRASASLPVEAAAHRIAETATTFAGGTLGDDLAIVLIERCPPPGGA
jgi:serine phosphatase RsbU (regulator of sigma subunit)/HAMP domain-containing protein